MVLQDSFGRMDNEKEDWEGIQMDKSCATDTELAWIGSFTTTDTI